MFCPLNLPDNHASGIVGKKYKTQSPVFGQKELMNKPPKAETDERSSWTNLQRQKSTKGAHEQTSKGRKSEKGLLNKTVEDSLTKEHINIK